MEKINQSITVLVASHLRNITKYKKYILEALHLLLNGNFIKYDIENSIYQKGNLISNEEDFQNLLSKINEKTIKRKDNGVYYTPNDVARYIICNSFITNIVTDNIKTYNIDDGLNLLSDLKIEDTNNLIYKKDLIDPACGSGEFLVNSFELKYKVAIAKHSVSDEKIINICRTLYGNDIDDESIDITKIRLFFSAVTKLKNKNSFRKLANALNNQFYNLDFIGDSKKINRKFDIVVGNPPYIEYGKYKEKKSLKNNFGNVYADFIKNSIDLLENKGVLGYVIPLSYISTTRMAKIRDYVIETTNKQFILNFADRPDCLFAGVHQKLNILIAKKGKAPHQMYTSNYKHWYKEERKELLNGREVRLCVPYSTEFIPKIGNEKEENIFRKIHTSFENNIYDIQSNNGENIYLNMRACFWIKAFSFNPGSNEYKQFKYSSEYKGFILCLLNSNLFWLYWTIMSDCWHITTKELRGFLIPNIEKINFDFDKLAKKLEKKLEKTKKYIGTKQTDYEYKHKLCKDIIDEIDDELSNVYNLTDDEVLYIKSYAAKYRLGGAGDD